jgi:F-type H+-transporting ATPase subunit alpha
VVIIYDDLSSHAEAYRQLSLLQEVDPGRDSYPGDMFYAHSSLLERAGKLLDGGKTLTALPVVLTPNDDITAYLSTSIMSITDGQIILDLSVFRRGIRPAVNAGLSVSRVGGQAQTVRQKRLSGSLFKMLARYKQAEEFSHFGSSLSKDARIDLTLGKQIYDVLQQPPEERHSLVIQQLMLETVILGGGEVEIDITGLKKSAKEVSSKVKDDKDFDDLEAGLLKKHSAKVNEAPAAASSATPPADPNAAKPAEEPKSEDKDGDKKDDKEKEQKESKEEEGKEKETEEKSDETEKDKEQDKDQEAKK